MNTTSSINTLQTRPSTFSDYEIVDDNARTHDVSFITPYLWEIGLPALQPLRMIDVRTRRRCQTQKKEKSTSTIRNGRNEDDLDNLVCAIQNKKYLASRNISKYSSYPPIERFKEMNFDESTHSIGPLPSLQDNDMLQSSRKIIPSTNRHSPPPNQSIGSLSSLRDDVKLQSNKVVPLTNRHSPPPTIPTRSDKMKRGKIQKAQQCDKKEQQKRDVSPKQPIRRISEKHLVYTSDLKLDLLDWK